MTAKTITLYTTDRCSFCVRAKTLLTQRELPFEEINLSRDHDGRVALARRTGMMTFPQILVGDQTLGGYRELAAADSDGTLAALLAA